VLGTQPDGDSVRFYPADPQGWATTRPRARVNPTPPAVSGSVLTRLADTQGRPVALTYAGTPPTPGSPPPTLARYRSTSHCWGGR